MAKWGGPSGNLTWPLNPFQKSKSKHKRRNKTQQSKQNKQQTKENNEDGLGPNEVALWATSPDP